jgi:uncharacterized membrane protein (UPF0127 family)
MKRFIFALALCALGGVVSSCSRDTAATTTTTTAVTATTTTLPKDQEQFDKIGLELIQKDGTVCQICVKIANTAAKRGVGLAGDEPLKGVDGMLFYSGEPMTGEFWMKDVTIPLDIHFFTLKGAPINTENAEPCTAKDDSKCERYKSDTPYGYALEVTPETTKKFKLKGATLSSILEHCPGLSKTAKP